MVTAPYNCPTMIYEHHSFWISFDRVSGNEGADKIPRFHLVDVEAIVDIVDDTKSVFHVDRSISTATNQKTVAGRTSTYIFDPNW
jgi:hypothetical protein